MAQIYKNISKIALMNTKEFALRLQNLYNVSQEQQAFMFLFDANRPKKDIHSVAYLNIENQGTASVISKIVYVCKVIDRSRCSVTLQKFETYHQFFEYVIDHKLQMAFRPQDFRLFLSKFL